MSGFFFWVICKPFGFALFCLWMKFINVGYVNIYILYSFSAENMLLVIPVYIFSYFFFILFRFTCIRTKFFKYSNNT
jgi:hypothetical protein